MICAVSPTKSSQATKNLHDSSADERRYSSDATLQFPREVQTTQLSFRGRPATEGPHPRPLITQDTLRIIVHSGGPSPLKPSGFGMTENLEATRRTAV